MPTPHRPRICYILPRYDPAIGSHFFHLYELLAAAAREMDVFVVVERAGAGAAAAPFRLRCQRFSFPPLRAVELLVLLVRERLRGYRDFYTHYSLFGGVMSWLVVRLFGGRAFYWNCGMPWLYRRGRFEEAAFRFVLRHTILVTGTVGIADEYRRRYGLAAARLRVLPNWINVERFRARAHRPDARGRLGLPREVRVVLFVHHLSQRKGAHLLPDIISGVTKVRKDVIFVIVGSGLERKNVECRIQNLELTEHVRFMGEVPHRDLPDYFAAADVFLMPSEEEGFPRVLLEAMASGVPYIASDVSGVREITPPELRGNLTPSGRADLFAQRVVTLLAQSAASTAGVAEVERGWVKRYDLPVVLRQFVRLFQK